MSMKINLVIVQPENYVHSLGFLDAADYVRYWFNTLGHEVYIGKNRLRHDAVNIVFGAHLGLPAGWIGPDFCTFIFNLEQIGSGGAELSEDYLGLLRSQDVIDYHIDNVGHYRPEAISDVPLIPFLNAPHRNRDLLAIDLFNRPIDLLFFGSINAERKAFLKRIERSGRDVAVFDSPTYYEERDEYVRQAKAVVNMSYYSTARFEQVRAFNVLSQGTAFISYQLSTQAVPLDFLDPVFWVTDDSFDRFFSEEFGTLEWCQTAQAKYSSWIQADPSHAFVKLLSILEQRWKIHTSILNTLPVSPVQVVQFDDGSYFQDAINLSPLEWNDPDLFLDLCKPQKWPWLGVTRRGQSIQLNNQQIERLLVHVAEITTNEWSALLTNAMSLVSDSGLLVVEVPISEVDFSGSMGCLVPKAKGVWLKFTDQFWRSGQWSHRFIIKGHQALNDQRQIVDVLAATFCRLIFEKRPTTSRERTLARVHRADFGLLD